MCDRRVNPKKKDYSQNKGRVYVLGTKRRKLGGAIRSNKVEVENEVPSRKLANPTNAAPRGR